MCTESAFGMTLATNDCIAVCSPGAVLTAQLFMERITLSPRSNPATQSDVELFSDEAYDFLIRPENSDIDTLLFVSPHLLFDLNHQMTALDNRPPGDRL